MSSSTASYRTAATSPSNQQSQHLPPPPPLQRPGSLRRRTSSSRRTASHDSYGDGVDQDDSGEADEPTTPLGPPVADPADEELEEIMAARASGEHSLGGWHYAPLLVGVVPPLGSIFGGNANTWSDALLLCLASFWLFQCLKIPNDIYQAARTRRVLQADQLAEEEDVDKQSHERIRRRRAAIAELQRTELIALGCCILSPIAGAYILQWLQHNLTDGQRYLNHFNIRLFTVAAGIRPLIHTFKLIRRRTLLLQEDVHFPSVKVESLQRRIHRLEADLSSLRKAAVSKDDVRLLRDGIDVPLTHMSRSIRRYEKKEEYLRTSAEDRFALVEARMEDLLRECAINAELIESERIERERSLSLGRSIFETFKYAVGQRNSAAALPDMSGRGLPSTAGNNPSSPTGLYSSPQSSKYHARPSNSAVAPSSSSSSVPGYGAQSTSSPGYANGTTREPVAGTHLAYGPDSPTGIAVDPTLHSAYGAPERQEWYERGVLYWAFLPLNLSNTVLRYAGDKVGSSSSKQTPLRARKMIGPPPPASVQPNPTSPPVAAGAHSRNPASPPSHQQPHLAHMAHSQSQQQQQAGPYYGRDAGSVPTSSAFEERLRESNPHLSLKTMSYPLGPSAQTNMAGGSPGQMGWKPSSGGRRAVKT